MTRHDATRRLSHCADRTYCKLFGCNPLHADEAKLLKSNGCELWRQIVWRRCAGRLHHAKATPKPPPSPSSAPLPQASGPWCGRHGVAAVATTRCFIGNSPAASARLPSSHQFERRLGGHDDRGDREGPRHRHCRRAVGVIPILGLADTPARLRSPGTAVVPHGVAGVGALLRKGFSGGPDRAAPMDCLSLPCGLVSNSAACAIALVSDREASGSTRRV